MRKYILVFFGLLTCLNFKAQTPLLDIAIHEYDTYNYLRNLVTIGNSNYINTSYGNVSFKGGACIYNIDNFGNIKFKKNILKVGYEDIGVMFPTLDKGILLAGSSDVCDYISANHVFYIMKIDSNGTTVFDKTVTWPYMSSVGGFFTGGFQVADSSYFLCSDSVLYHLSKNGAVLKKKNTGLNSIKAVLGLNNGKLILSAKTGTVLQVIEMDTSCNIINQSNSIYTFSKFQKNSNGIIFGQSGSFLVKLNPNYSYNSNSISSQGSGNNINDFVISNDTLFCSGYSAGLQFLYYKFDSNLSNLYQKNNPTNNINPIKLSVNGSGIAFINSEYPPGAKNRCFSILRTDETGSFTVPNDVGVTDVTLDTGYAVIFMNYVDAYYKLKVKVQNFGSDTLNSVFLNLLTDASPGCGNVYYHQKFSNIKLASGNFTFLTTSLLTERVGGFTNNPPLPGTPFSLNNRCVWTSAPNDLSDANHSNDNTCKNFNVKLLIVDELKYFSEYLKAYPNPFEEYLTFESKSFPIEKIEIYDATGKMVMKKSKTEIDLEHINTQELKNGFYLARIYSEKVGYCTLKLVKN